jgi:hypothetical protein
VTIELSRHGLRVAAGSFGAQTIWSIGFAARSEDRTIIRLGLVAPKCRPIEAYGAVSLRGDRIEQGCRAQR